ncbi:hypothetical protein [Snuella lapsa]|uniref:Secreted protein n=1 Tax=Snuella lapsa TaxID=870481 RepID=A0ABP6X4Q8_9FLAO
MKKLISILSAAVFFFALFFQIFNTSKIESPEASIDIASLISLNVANAEEYSSTTLYCRCHSDGICYGGNMISFRPKCGEFPSGQGDCTSFSTTNC